MCEPNHSINQYPDDENGSKVQAAYEGASMIAKVKTFAKKIGGWLQFSMMGKGHSEQLAARNLTMYRVAEPTRYEARWWDRGFHLDGPFVHDGIYLICPAIKALEADALDSARIYAERVSIGNLSIFRRFFEASIQASDRPSYYLEQFFDNMLNDDGHRIMESKMKRLGLNLLDTEPVTKICLGLSRQRKLLVPEWADDNKIWVPA